MNQDDYVIKIAKKYHIQSSVDIDTQNTIISPLRSLISQWAGTCLNDIQLSGSRAKGTAISLSSDLDLFVSLKSTTSNSLSELYNSLYHHVTQAGYKARKQNVSIGINIGDKQIDLVPAKKRSGNTNYHSLYLSKQKTWTQTNITEHINIVRRSDRITEIVLLKIWSKLHKLDFPSIYLELIVIEALKGRNTNNSAENFLLILNYIMDKFTDKKIIDPSNTNNIISNDLNKTEKEIIKNQAISSRYQSSWGKIIW
ncbi:hypothetical protein ABEW61_02325 [Paenibacillus amylolyticus]|uniref:SMODS domain-containing nucleotidyltransferase n=1 Tax=Paenibacillus amylolyticus TaxID=1451 RepID=UPI003D2E9968